MNNAEKQQLKLDTELAIEVFKRASNWDKNEYEKRFGPLNYKTALNWPPTSELMAGACVADMTLHIQRCRRLGCEPTAEGFACIMAMTEEMQEHLIEHNEHDERNNLK